MGYTLGMAISISAVRAANRWDISRIAEILVFSKRMHYRDIFRDYAFSFGTLQVLPTAQAFLEQPAKLSGYYVYDDEYVKGLIHLEEDEIAELYVDPFFEHQHIGSALMEFALRRILHPGLWVLEGNESAVRFYQKKGFVFTGERKFVPGTDRYEARMRHQAPVNEVLGKIVRVTVDRPLGSCHPDYPGMIYPVNYGYVEGVPAGDGEWQDAYILGIREPLQEFTGKITAIIQRADDAEDKWVVVPENVKLSEAEIREQTLFQEQYFNSKIIL